MQRASPLDLQCSKIVQKEKELVFVHGKSAAGTADAGAGEAV